MQMKYYVKIKERKSGIFVKTLGPYSGWRAAVKAQGGVLVNLNHEDYETEIVEA